MSEQVKRYSLSEFAEQHTHPVGPGTYVDAADYDALHAEAEALRAENGRLMAELSVAMKVPSVAAMHSFLEKECAQQNMQLGKDLEVARGLLRELHNTMAEYFPGDNPPAHEDLMARVAAALTATPATEVPDHIEHDRAMVEQGESLDDRLKQAGMLSVAELLKGAPLDAFIKHAGVHDLASLLQWAEMRRGEYLRMMARYDLGEKDKGDDLYEWTVAHCAVFTELHVNLRASLADQGERQEAVARVGIVPGTDFKSLDFFGIDLQELPAGTKLYTTPQPGPDVRGLVEALEHARLFIRNGVELGYVKMPDADTPDPAHETLPKIEAALAAHRQAQRQA